MGSYFKTVILQKTYDRLVLKYELEAHSEPSQISKMKILAKIVDGFPPLTISQKRSILDVSLGSECASVGSLQQPRFERICEWVRISSKRELWSSLLRGLFDIKTNTDKSETIKRSKNQTLIHCLKSVHIRNFLCVFFRVRTEYGDLLSKYLYSVRMRENTLCVGTLFFFTLVKPFNVSFYRQRL